MTDGIRHFATPARCWPHLWTLLCLVLFASGARGEDDDLRSLELYNGEPVAVVSADRSPRPASQTAENITVVTASEIEALNAHTLADVLYTVAGVQVELLRTPGGYTFLEIQGSNFNHILVLIDNVAINSLSENVADIASVPAQMIERVEIVKGAASSSWGSALGGVVNVITKFPRNDRTLGGLVSGSIGKRATADGRAEVSGALDRFGYYLTGGKLRSDGLTANNEVDLNHVYGKLRYDLPAHGSLTLTTGLTHGEGGLFRVEGPAPREDNADTRLLLSTLSLQYPIADRLHLEGMLKTRQSRMKIDSHNVLSGATFSLLDLDETANGASLIVSWLDDLQRLVAGVDYDHVQARNTQPTVFKKSVNRVGVYLNDTFSIGAFAITPSIRFDHTGTGGDLFSPSFGITYALTENTVLRGYTARGYSITSISRPNSTEKVWTSQLGFETAEIPYLWLKGTLLRNDTWDVNVLSLNPDGSASFRKHRQLKEGFEVEARTTPVFDASLSISYTFLDAKDETIHEIIEGVPRHTLNLGLRYENSDYLRALLNGHYVDWNGPGTEFDGKYDAVIWDLHLGKKFPYSEYGAIEIFGSVHNLFNDSQNLFPFKNPRRWWEVGAKWEF